MPMRPDVCIYHFPCSDGLTAAWAVRLKWPDIKFVPSNYGDGFDLDSFSGLHVLMVDFTYPRDVVEQLLSVAASVTILDHHESAMKVLQPLLDEGLVEGQFDMSRSGARMAWDYCFPCTEKNPFDTVGAPTDYDPVTDVWLWDGTTGVVPRLVDYVQDRDLWTWLLPNSRAVNAWIGSHKMDFEHWEFIAAELQNDKRFAEIVEIGGACVEQIDTFVTSTIAAGKRLMVIGGIEVEVVNAPHFLSSDIGNILSRGAPFAATYFDNGKGERVFSLRSQFGKEPGALDVSKIAGLYGGGGHKPASGFRAEPGWEGDEATNVVALRA